VKWPRYIKRQRHLRTLSKRFVIPGPINQFRTALDKNAVSELFKLLNAIRPETSKEKKARLLEEAKKPDAKAGSEKPIVVKFGLKHVTRLIEQKKAKLVIIAHDVEPLELVLYLPTLCRKKGVAYCIVKSKSRLGTVVHKKQATVLAIVDVKGEDKNSLQNLIKVSEQQFNNKYVVAMKSTGGKSISIKTREQRAKIERQRKKDEKGAAVATDAK